MRKPNKKELRELELLIHEASSYAMELTDIRNMLKESYMTVFDDYTVSNLAYSGKAMFWLSPDIPEFYMLYIWENGKITEVEQGEEVRKEDEFAN